MTLDLFFRSNLLLVLKGQSSILNKRAFEEYHHWHIFFVLIVMIHFIIVFCLGFISFAVFSKGCHENNILRFFTYLLMCFDPSVYQKQLEFVTIGHWITLFFIKTLPSMLACFWLCRYTFIGSLTFLLFRPLKL